MQLNGIRQEAQSREGAQKGFVLIQALIALAMSWVLAMWAVPGFNEWRMRDQVHMRSQALVEAFALARSEAAARSVHVTVCRSDGRGQCARPGIPCIAGALDWSCGWLVFAESPDAGVPRLLRSDAALTNVAIASHSTSMTFLPPAGVAVGRFRSFSFRPAYRLASGSFVPGRCVRIAAGGRARVTEGVCDAQTV